MYNPGVENRSGELLARGIMAAADGISKVLEQRQAKAEQAKRLRKGLAGLFPERKDEFEAMGLPDLEGTQDQIVMKRAQQIFEQRQQSEQQQRALLEQQITSLRGQNQERAAGGKLNEILTKHFETPETIRRPVNPELLLQFAARAGVPMRDIDPRLLEQYDAGNKLGLGKTVDLPGGGRLIGTGGAPHFERADAPKNPQLYPANDPVTGKPIPGMALTGSGSAVQTGERGGLKDLSQTEVDRISALNQAGSDLDTLEHLYNALDKDYGGPIMGRVRARIGGITGDNADITALQNAVTAATPNLARGVFREVGVLTDEDVKRYQQLLPSPTDSAGARKKKFEQLRERIAQGKKETMDQLRKAGRDVKGFGPSAAQPAPANGSRKFDSEQAARDAGLKTGDAFLFYDSRTATYRKARLR